jgi:hypothetical protein
MFVYLITNTATGKYYVGQHKGNDLKKYLQQKLSQAWYELKRKGHGGGSILFNSMRKHPKDVWEIHPLVEDVQTKEAVDAWERTLIELFNSRNPMVGYNICRGGEGPSGCPCTSLTRRRLSVANKKAWQVHPERREIRSVQAKTAGQKPPAGATVKSITVRRQTQEQSGVWPGAPLNDMTGTVVNGVSVLRRLENTKDGDAVWECRCSCETLFTANGGSLRSGHTRSCGCLKAQQDQKNLKGSPLKNLIGMKFNGVEVVGRAPDKITQTKAGKTRVRVRWECRCPCGNTFVASGGNLKSGHTKSCGCFRRKFQTMSIEAIHRWKQGVAHAVSV